VMFMLGALRIQSNNHVHWVCVRCGPSLPTEIMCRKLGAGPQSSPGLLLRKGFGIDQKLPGSTRC